LKNRREKMNYKEEFIELMVKSNVLQFGEFQAKSGRITPYFINTGLYKYGKDLHELGKYYAEVFNQRCDHNQSVLYGPAYKGIPLVVITATALADKFSINVPISFNRKEKKDHGEGGIIVGKVPTAEDKVVIIEDVITAGTAIRESIEIMDGIGVKNIDSIIIAVDRMEKGKGELSTLQELENELGIKTYPIVNINEIVKYLYNKSIDGKIYIDDHMKQSIEKYLNKYGAR